MFDSQFQAIIAPAADCIDKLRAIDLERVLMNAYDNFPASLTVFVGWLEKKRPDLTPRLALAIHNLTEEGLWQ